MATDTATAPTTDEHDDPTPRTRPATRATWLYIRVALFLAVMTAVEVAPVLRRHERQACSIAAADAAHGRQVRRGRRGTSCTCKFDSRTLHPPVRRRPRPGRRRVRDRRCLDLRSFFSRLTLDAARRARTASATSEVWLLESCGCWSRLGLYVYAAGHRPEGRARRRARRHPAPARWFVGRRSSCCGRRRTGRCTTSPRSTSTSSTWCSTWLLTYVVPAAGPARHADVAGPPGGRRRLVRRHVVRRLCRPVAAGRDLQRHGRVHPLAGGGQRLRRVRCRSTTALHTVLVASALLMWMPVCGPLPELRLSLPGADDVPVPDVDRPHDPRRLAHLRRRRRLQRLRHARSGSGASRVTTDQQTGRACS